MLIQDKKTTIEALKSFKAQLEEVEERGSLKKTQILSLWFSFCET